MFWRLVLHRIILTLIGKVILIPVTAYCAYYRKPKLPNWCNLFDCEEDGWDGTGRHPNHPRALWPVNGVMQGWWWHYKGLVWEDTGFLNRWYYGYWWCAWRNTVWNLRLAPWFAESIHFNDIRIHRFDTRPAADVRWYTNKGKDRYFKRVKLFKDTYLEYGFEFKTELFDVHDPNYARVRKQGYLGIWKYRATSIPSIRLRTIKEVTP